MSAGDLLDRCVASLQEAAFDPARWTGAAALLNEASGAKGHAIGVGGGGWPHSKILFVRVTFGARRREALEKEYFQNHWSKDDRVMRFVRLPPGRVVPTADLYTDEEKATSFTYNELLRLYDSQHGLNVRIDSPEGLNVMWVLADSVTPPNWDSAQIETVERLVPHVRQFARVRQVVDDAGALGSSLAELLDNVRFGVIQLDARARIVAANDQARNVLRQDEGLVDKGRSLGAHADAENRKLRELLAQALPPPGVQGVSGSMTVGRSHGRTRLAVHVTPVARHEWDFSHRGAAALVLVVDPESPSRIDAGIVAEALGLTPAESRLAVMLATGHSLRDIAERSGRSYGTIRWHLQRILQKQDVSRQADLVRRILSLDGFPGSPP